MTRPDPLASMFVVASWAEVAALGPGTPVLIAGVGGGAAPEVRAGDLVVADAVPGCDFPVPVSAAPLLTGALRRLGATVHVGPAWSVSREHITCAPGSPNGTATLAGAGGPFAVLRAVTGSAEHPLRRPGTVRGLRALRMARFALRQWAAAVGPREVVLAGPRSFCAGVTRAIDTVEAALARFGAPVYVRRQIVHNTHVVRELQAKGVVFVHEVDEVPPGALLVLAAHGVAPAVRVAASERGLTVVDATCPLVAKVHTEIRRHAGRGDTVLFIGHADHEEVEGSRGEAPADVLMVEDVAAARRVTPRDPDRVVYAVQTTLAVDEVAEIADVLHARFPRLTAPRTDDICYATTNRQRAVRAVARQTDLVLVVGSPNSSNSQRLAEVAAREGTPAHLVDDVAEVDLRWLAGAHRVGVTAGASAPPDRVDALVAALGGLGPVTTREERVTREDVTFTLPKDVI